MIELRIWLTTSYTANETGRTFLLRTTDGVFPAFDRFMFYRESHRISRPRRSEGTLIGGEDVTRLAAQKTTLKAQPSSRLRSRASRNVRSDQPGHTPSRPAFILSLVGHAGIIIRISVDVSRFKIGSSSRREWKNARANKRSAVPR